MPRRDAHGNPEVARLYLLTGRVVHIYAGENFRYADRAWAYTRGDNLHIHPESAVVECVEFHS